MGNLAFQVADKSKIDSLIWDMRSEIADLQRRNRKLTGALKQKRIEHIKLNQADFLDSIDNIQLGDIVEVICTKEEYKLGKDEYFWPYTVNKGYKALVTYKYPGYSGYLTLLFMDYAEYKDRNYKGDAYKLAETIDISDYELNSEVYQIRILLAADKDSMEFYKR